MVPYAHYAVSNRMFWFICIAIFGYVKTETISCDIIIAGGSTAALGAAIQAARKSVDDGYTVCLTEPTDWIGGQLTSSAVSAIDYGQFNRNWWFQSELFEVMMDSLGPGNPGRCWVSTKCYLPKDLIRKFINKTVASLPNLRIFYNTVLKSVQRQNKILLGVTAIKRVERNNVDQWTNRLSDMISDWYNLENSILFTKTILNLVPKNNNRAVFIDASELGDVLVLSNAPFRQGVEIPTEESDSVNDSCGQRFTIPFFIRYEQYSSTSDQTPNERYGTYSLDNQPWGKIWSYRRSIGFSGHSFHEASEGEISNQNWSHGNDFYDKSLLLQIRDTNSQISDWEGGIDISALQLAESRAFGWYHEFKNNSPSHIRDHLKIGRSDIIGTATGLAKVPYIRDTRRSIGISNFVLRKSDMAKSSCNSTASGNPPFTGNALNCSEYSTRFHDSIGLGNYVADVHGVNGCSWPKYINNHHTLPFHIPFRALTNYQYDNLLVAGKTMAQTFMANAATRTHPTEFVTGEAAGIAAVQMLKRSYTTLDMYNNIDILQKELIKELPIYWDQPRTSAASIIIG